MSAHARRGFSIAACAMLLLASLAPRARAADGSAFDDLDREQERTKTSDDPARQMQEDLSQSRRGMRADVDEADRQKQEDWSRLSAQMEEQYRDMARKMAEQRAWFKTSVERQWTEFQDSTSKEWVDYNERGDSRSKVDFEKGKIEVEVLVPLEEVAPSKKKIAGANDLDGKEREKLRALAEEKIRAQTRKMLSTKEEHKAEVLKDQVKTKDGSVVTEKNSDRFVKEQLAPAMVIEDKPVVAQDGKPRLKVKVKIDMVPDHLKIRASRYAGQIGLAARKYGLDPALIYAVIHTESEFNPKAKSPSGALGLMQIVPRTAGNEAYKYLYKQDKLVTPEYLFDPDNNILLGSTYLHMLMTRHYGKIKDPDNRRSLTVAAYNCGPGNVRKSVTSGRDIDALSNAEVVGLIRKFAPKETQVYVPRVEGRMSIYRDY
ncbi:MAG: transglycosylase SLT domain-containing protein [Elusimicrobia bacterium]|nr:transglycosylase SLT domain-containing protein [Elusimicrobiota bacterium]